jgi:hypothetical protein
VDALVMLRILLLLVGSIVLAAPAAADPLLNDDLTTCCDNPFALTVKHTIAVKLVDNGFSDIEPSSGFMVVYAAKHGETALDGEGADSPFFILRGNSRSSWMRPSEVGGTPIAAMKKLRRETRSESYLI